MTAHGREYYISQRLCIISASLTDYQATSINEKPQIVAEYESGKAIPNPQIISKIERKLGCKLPRPGKKPAAKKTPGSSTGPGARVGGRTGGVVRGGPPKRR